MRAVPEEGGGQRLELAEIELPPRRPDQALIRVAYGGVCGTDLHYWLHGAAGASILRHPMTLGHEVVGTVEEAAADGSGPAAGTPVAVHPATPGDDGRTRYPAERPNLSPRCTYLGSAAHDPHTEGAFSRLAVLETRMLRPLPEGLGLREAALAEPAGVALHAVSRAGDLRGREVLVIGCGPIGSLIIAAAARAGAARITAVDLHESALERARELGAEGTLHRPDAAEIAEVQADVVFESSGSWQGTDSALRGAARGGRVLMVGLLPPGQQPVDLSIAIARELELLGCFRFNDEIDEALAALADGSLRTGPIVSHVMDLDDAREAFETARRAEDSCKVLLRF
ncbi:zinc-binding dehydrogenase [Rothia sp. AR01]|uniref:Zinc-binding dehydrogenase n=1 Tax=Rothia santali TaxID=2949643 RepID=A0A9X2HDC2_9MICC|nr:zinc-binding dehydrogenase [Rothia santali]MCP3425089.1 zinc-binding dehydrogenase [Rothia santali]